jgi:hypothetical protein
MLIQLKKKEIKKKKMMNEKMKMEEEKNANVIIASYCQYTLNITAFIKEKNKICMGTKVH